MCVVSDCWKDETEAAANTASPFPSSKKTMFVFIVKCRRCRFPVISTCVIFTILCTLHTPSVRGNEAVRISGLAVNTTSNLKTPAHYNHVQPSLILTTAAHTTTCSLSLIKFKISSSKNNHNTTVIHRRLRLAISRQAARKSPWPTRGLHRPTTKHTTQASAILHDS